MNNLEEIEFGEVRNAAGTVYTEYRRTLRPRYRKVIIDILKGYLFLLATVCAVVLLSHSYPRFWWVYLLPGSVVIGYIVAYLALFIHEASHFNIHPDKKKNDRIATIFLCIPFGLSIKAYRKIHWQHHVHLGTTSDTEVSYFNALTRLFFLETLTGIHLLRTMLKKNSNTVLTVDQMRESKRNLLIGALIHATLLAIAFVVGEWIVGISWLLGFGIFFPFFATIRQVLEHRDELALRTFDYTKQPHGKVSRLFTHTILNSSFGAAGFTRHMIHHWDPQISYTRLRDIEDFLLDSERTVDIVQASRTHYRTVLKKLLRAS